MGYFERTPPRVRHESGFLGSVHLKAEGQVRVGKYLEHKLLPIVESRPKVRYIPPRYCVALGVSQGKKPIAETSPKEYKANKL